MANEQLTIEQDKARLSVIGKSWPDMNFDSGIGLDLSQIIFDILIDLDIPMPDIDFDDLDNTPIIPGLDIDTEIPTLEYPDPDWPDVEIPPILDWSMPDLDWDDFIDKLEDLDLDLDILKDLSFVGLNDLGIPTLVSLDEDFNIQMDELPASIEIVTPPNKLEYQDGERIDLTGMVVTAKKSDGSTWTSAKYPNGHIPLGELIVNPMVTDYSKVIDEETISDLIPGGLAYGSGTIHATNPEGTRYDFLDGGSAGCWANGSVITAAGSPFIYRYGEFWGGQERNVITGNAGAYTYDGKTVYYSGWSGGMWSTWDLNVPKNTYEQQVSAEAVAWTMIYGTTIGGNQVISISWPRYSDGMLLSAAFEIKVTPGSGGR